MIKIVYHQKAHNVRVWLEGHSEVPPEDCGTLYSAIGKLVKKHPKLFNIEEIQAYGKSGKSS